MCGQTGTFCLSPWKNMLAEATAEFGASLSMRSHGNAPRSPLATLSLRSFYTKPSFLLHPGLPGPCPCPFACPVPSILAGLHEQQWDHSESHGKLTIPAHPKDIPRPAQPHSSASETATGSKTEQLALIILNYHKSSILAFLPLLPPELCSLINRNRTFLSPLIASSSISCLEG